MNDDLQVKIGGDPSGAVSAMDAVNARARAFSQDLISEVAKVTAAYLGFEKAIEGVKDGMLKADEIRDLSMSLATFTGSVSNAASVMREFEESARRTRSTAEELGRTFRDIFPLASARGFSQEATAQMTTMLSQLATVAGTSLEAMEGGFQQLLAGRVSPGRNPLLKVLGITKGDVEGLNWGLIIDKVKEVSKHAEEMGDTWDVAAKKIKNAWGIAFGEGFNEALDGSRKAYKSLEDAMTQTGIVDSLSAVGYGIGLVVQKLREVGEAWEALKLEGAIGPSGMLRLGVSNGDQAVDLLRGMKGAQSLKDNFNAGLSALTAHGLGSGYTLEGMDSDHFIQSVGSFVTSHTGEQTKELFAEIRDSAKDGILTIDDWRDAFANAVDVVAKADDPFKKMRQDLVDQAKAAAAAKAAWKELQDQIAETVKNAAGESAYAGANGLPQIDTPMHRQIMKMFGGMSNPLVFGSIGEGVNPSIDAATLEQARQRWIATSIEGGKAYAKAFGDALTNERFLSDFGMTFSRLVSNGGHDFMRILGAGFGSLIDDNAKALTTSLFGKQGDPSRVDANGNPQNFSRLYDAHGNDITGRAQMGREVLGGAQVFAGGYSAGLSGQPGGRTAATLGGAVTGFEMFGGPAGGPVALAAAAVGAILGALGGMFGAKQAQAEYMYGVPTIDASGVAHLGNTKNLVPSRVKEIEAQVQAEYDQIHDGLIGLITKFPNVAIPSFEQISGKFQDNPSAHWQEHLQQWITGTLPHQLMGAVEDELATGFSGLGMSKDAFSHIFDFMQGIDPSKAVQELVMLADSLKTINEATTGFHQGFGSVLNDVGMKATRTPGAVLGEMDDEIIRLAKSLGSLSPEGQISTLQQIAGLEKQRWDAEKAAATELLNLAQQAKEQFADFFGQLDLQGMVKADGSPDFYSQSQFYKKRTDTDLSEIYGATTTAEAQKWLQKFFQDVMQAEQLGIQGDPSHRNDWIQWARTAGQTGQTTLDDTIKRLGGSIDGANSLFNSKVDPALDAFTGKVTTTSTAVDNLGGAIGRTIDPIDRFTDHMNSIVGTLAAADARIARMFSGSGGNDNGFATRTAAARVR